VTWCRASDFPSFDDCQNTKAYTDHPDQTYACTKIRNRDCVFPWHGEHQEPKGSERKLAQNGKLFCSEKRAGGSIVIRPRRSPGTAQPRRKPSLMPQPKQLRDFLNNSSPRPRESAEVSHLNHLSSPSRFHETDLNRYGVVLIQPLRRTYVCVFAWLQLEL